MISFFPLQLFKIYNRTGEAPRAYIVKKDDCEVTEQEINEYVKDNVVKYKQLKGGIKFVDEIPTSQAGKILRKELALKYKNEQAENNMNK